MIVRAAAGEWTGPLARSSVVGRGRAVLGGFVILRKRGSGAIEWMRRMPYVFWVQRYVVTRRPAGLYRISALSSAFALMCSSTRRSLRKFPFTSSLEPNLCIILTLLPEPGQLVAGHKDPLDALFGDDGHANRSSRGAVARHGECESCDV